MKYKDYYETLGLARTATQDEIKQAYRKLAHKHHPDMSKEAGAEARFKEIAEAYRTLKDPEKRAEYDRLGQHRSGETVSPPPDWGDGAGMYGDVDLEDFFAAFTGARRGAGKRRATPQQGQDFEVKAPITVEQLHAGAEIEVSISMPDYDEHGMLQRVPRTFRVKLPKGAQDGQRMRLAGKGGAGVHGGPSGDLYIVLTLEPHPLYRVSGHNLYLDLTLAPWEAVLGALVTVPTPAGKVELTVPPHTVAGRRFRLSGRGLPIDAERFGDLYALVRIDVPKTPTARERALLAELASVSDFNPRGELRPARQGEKA